MIVRKATLDDVENVYYLYKIVTKSDPYHLTQLNTEVHYKYVEGELKKALELGLSLVIEKDDKIIGFMKAYTSEYVTLAHVLANTTVMIHPDYQNKGYGTLLLSNFLDMIQNDMQYIYELELVPHETNNGAILFYKKNGFKEEYVSHSKIFNKKNNNFEDEICLIWKNPSFNMKSLEIYHNYLIEYTTNKYECN